MSPPYEPCPGSCSGVLTATNRNLTRSTNHGADWEQTTATVMFYVCFIASVVLRESQRRAPALPVQPADLVLLMACYLQ